MNKTRHYIRTLLLMLLLLAGGGMANEAWAKKVTYHILTKPFTVMNHNNSGPYKEHIRVEALQCTSEEETVGLPDQFKSPLATNFQYWAKVNPSSLSYDYLYDYVVNKNVISAKYYIYKCTADNDNACLSEKITDPANTSSDGYTDIYVTYDYNSSNDIVELNGGTYYNISVDMSGTLKFMCLNRSRNNRVANAKSSALTGEDLADNDFVVPENGKQEIGWPWGSGDNKIWGPKGVHLGFKFLGEDPYNITIMTSYTGNEVHVTDATGVDNSKSTIKPYEGATLFGKMGNNQMWFDVSNDRHYKILSDMSNSDVDLKTGNYKDPSKYETCKTTYTNASEAARYDTWVGFYRKENYAELNTYALLPNPNGDYLFVASKMNMGTNSSTKPDINQPNSSKYYLYNDGGNQPHFALKTLDNAYKTNFYAIRTYTVHVTTKGSSTPLSATMKWSDARLDDALVDHIPNVLKRKYVTYTAYSDAAHTKPVTSFKDIKNADNGNNIYLDYTVSDNTIPFKALPTDGDYKDAQWYTMRMDGVANPKFIAYEGASNALVVTDGSGNAKGSNTASEVHKGENSAEAMVAFMGDPYELKILNRKACVTANGNKFIGCATGSALDIGLSTNKTTSDITTWEIVYESIGETGFMLRQFNTASSTPKYIGLGSAANDKPVTYSETASRIRVVELDRLTYTYHIVRDDYGNIAVKASDSHDVGKELQSWTDIPEIIRSPFLKDGAVTFYGSLADAKGKTNAIHNAPYDSNRDIYVRYSVSVSGDNYNVRLNNDYIYTTDEGDVIKSKAMLDEGNSEIGAYQWFLDYSDPYRMTIKNNGKSKYVNVSFSDEASITWSDSPSYFVAKSGAIPGTYEVMAATGDEIDASATNYNIGRPSANTVKLYSSSSYQHGNAVLRFQLIGTTATRVVYHLIDKAGKDLLQATTRQITTAAPDFPPEYHSPLVSKYHYYIKTDFDYNSTTDTYTLKTTPTKPDEQASVSAGQIYVTYDVNDLVDLKAGQLYLLKYEAGEEFRQENGSDGLLADPSTFTGTDEEKTARYKAVYPYCNGDGNFFLYGQEQYDIQQEGASSTRTRWAWYVESNVEDAPLGDPYHVMIKSRQTESYPITNSSEYNAYFMTYKPNGYDKVITALGWPGMNSETATEYMVLGSEGQYQLVTSYTIPIDLNNDGDTEDEGENNRYVVNSFEQYWKTFDTIRKKVYGESSAKENDNDSWTVPLDALSKYNGVTEKTLRDSLTNELHWHSYEKWAYAKRWNGYNNGYSSTEGTHEKKKGWEKIEHWFQTVDMGEGYFDFVKTEINPVLILLDQHGWEIMRKPIPTDPEDPQKDAKYAAIRPYNSPMVKEYAFWATAKKRSGFHQYYLLSDRIGGDDFTSTDLTSLPPYTSKNVHDKKGNLNDQYVTYIVKDEYAQTYNPQTATGKPFLIEQGTDHKYATTNEGGTTLTASNIPHPYDGDIKAYILNKYSEIPNTEKWYVKPNANIDIEMGYNDTGHSWTNKKADGSWENKNPNAYDVAEYKDNTTAVYIDQTTEYKEASDGDKTIIKEAYGFFSFSNGFDPYNIQISSVQEPSKYMKTNANGATLEEGSLVGSYPTDPNNPTDPDPDPKIAMGDNTTTISPAPKWYDSRNLAVTNATFMAVQDADGNMQLMPRFDHTTRMSEFGTLIAPVDENVAKTYTKLYRPEVYEYLIIDNSGHESLRYKSGGDMTPQTPDHFRSPLATNFKYYATATYDSETGIYSDIENDENEIKESLDGATLTENTNGNKVVYVRYEYDEEADSWNMLKGNWLTIQLNDKNAVYDNGMKQASGDKPSPIDNDDKQWQWKFAHNSQPDPYAIYIYNRSQSPAGTKVIIDLSDRFALLYHSAGDYALAKAGEGTYTYSFLNGDGMSTETPASIVKEAGFTPTSDTFDETKSQVRFIDEVTHNFTYKVYTNGGVEAISATQSQEDVFNYDWKPRIPNEIKTPLLNLDQFRYYSKDDYERIVEARPDTIGKNLSSLYGLYDDEMVVRYTPYNPSVTAYQVPNVRNDVTIDIFTDNVAKDNSKSNDAPIGLDGKNPYNIIWYTDNMMKSNNTSITYDPNKILQYTAEYEWVLEGEDPYAIQIKNVKTGTYLHKATTTTTELSDNATPFMLLNKDGYDYGVFAKTGDATTMLSGYGDVLTTSDPTHFIPFALSTYKVIYHLIIANICTDKANPAAGQYVDIPYSEKDKEGLWVEGFKPSDNKTKRIFGTTLRDLKTKDETGEGHINGDYYQLGRSLKSIQTESSGLFQRDDIYCYDAGHISLGDAFEVPQAFYRPNVSYDYYIEGVYSADGKTEISDMNNKYKGLKKTNLDDDTGLLGNIVYVNIVYSFTGGLDTNSGTDFVTGVDKNKWYTFETSDATPRLAEYTGSLQTKSGYATHYTNDYLWTPVGDPYGFKMYNRYIQKNLGENMVMSTENFNPDTPVQMVLENKIDPKDGKSEPHLPANSVYELLANSSTTSGYFRVHPVANKKVLTSDPQYYIKNDNGVLKLNTTPTEWTFGLSEDLMRPYYQGAGYVGGLNAAGKTAYEEALEVEGELAKLMALQNVVYNHDNNNAEDDPTNPNYIVHYTPGYYRLHSQPGSSDITTPRYASGYTHAIERDLNGDNNESDAIPMHFYEVEEYDVNNPTFKDLGTAGTDFTETAATRGDIPLVTVAKDPASIFRFTGDASSATMSTQGLYVKENKMTKTSNEATSFAIIDIGAGIVALQGGLNYLKYAQNEYDLKFDNTASTIESTRWCMRPVQKGTNAGYGEMALKVTTNNGGDENYYTTFYAPFDVLLTDVKDEAFVLPTGGWPTIDSPETKAVIHPKKIGQYNTKANGCPEEYQGKNQFIPAGTPVIIRTKNTGGIITMALPTATPSTPITNDLSGEYLEQMLAQNSSKYVYTFGRSYTHSDEFAYNGATGIVTPAGLDVDKGVGFYINASNNRESSATRTMWTRNNKYVYGNKIYYYRPTEASSPSSAPKHNHAPEYIPVVFDDDEGEQDEELKPDGTREVIGDGCVYDLMGRKVATREQVEDGSWKQRVATGIYIINGKKIRR